MVKWPEEKIISIIYKARKAGKEAAQAKLAELCLKYGKEPYENHPTYGRCATFLGMCGYGWVVIDAKQGFYRAAKKLAEEKGRTLRFNCTRNYGGGGQFSVYDISNRQEYEINVAAEQAVADVLKAEGIKVIGLHTWID